MWDMGEKMTTKGDGTYVAARYGAVWIVTTEDEAVRFDYLDMNDHDLEEGWVSCVFAPMKERPPWMAFLDRVRCIVLNKGVSIEEALKEVRAQEVEKK